MFRHYAVACQALTSSNWKLGAGSDSLRLFYGIWFPTSNVEIGFPPNTSSCINDETLCDAKHLKLRLLQTLLPLITIVLKLSFLSFSFLLWPF